MSTSGSAEHPLFLARRPLLSSVLDDENNAAHKVSSLMRGKKEVYQTDFYFEYHSVFVSEESDELLYNATPTQTRCHVFTDESLLAHSQLRSASIGIPAPHVYHILSIENHPFAANVFSSLQKPQQPQERGQPAEKEAPRVSPTSFKSEQTVSSYIEGRPVYVTREAIQNKGPYTWECTLYSFTDKESFSVACTCKIDEPLLEDVAPSRLLNCEENTDEEEYVDVHTPRIQRYFTLRVDGSDPRKIHVDSVVIVMPHEYLSAIYSGSE